MDPLPVLNEYGEEDKRIASLQAGFASRLRKSPYYIVENKKSTGDDTCRHIHLYH
jgi:DNA-directed RNA polymerase III subunit RPC7